MKDMKNANGAGSAYGGLPSRSSFPTEQHTPERTVPGGADNGGGISKRSSGSDEEVLHVSDRLFLDEGRWVIAVSEIAM